MHAHGLLPGRVRLLFQPAEEVMPGGALHLMTGPAPSTASTQVFGLHCDPTLDVARSACARARSPAPPTALEVRLDRQRRPHLAART